jgi:hypothetical protein
VSTYVELRDGGNEQLPSEQLLYRVTGTRIGFSHMIETSSRLVPATAHLEEDIC